MRHRTSQLPTIAQIQNITCGVACARSVLKYLNHEDFGEEELAEKLGVQSLGYTALEPLLALFRAHGLHSVASKQNTLAGLRGFLRLGQVLMVTFFTLRYQLDLPSGIWPVFGRKADSEPV